MGNLQLGDPRDRPLYDTVVLTKRRRKDAMGCMRPSARDRLVQEVVKQVLSWPPAKIDHVRAELGRPRMDVAVVTSFTADLATLLQGAPRR